MTPQERARFIDKQEFEAECKAIRERAYALHRQGQRRDSRVQASINRGPVTAATQFNPIKKPSHLANSESTADALTEPGKGRGKAKFLTHNGKTQSINQWAHERGIKPCTLRYRLHMGWDTARSIETPIRFKAPTKGYHDNDEVIPGVLKNLSSNAGTGAGSTLQDTLEITFSIGNLRNL